MTRLALLTGTSRGLGQALAAQLRAQGWHVAGLSRRAVEPGDIAVDLARPAMLAPAFDAAVRGAGPDPISELLVVHNAAAIEPIGPTAWQPTEAIEAALTVNLTAGVLLFGLATARFQSLPVRKVLAQVSSGAALRPHAGLSLYAAAKAGLEQHLRVLAVEQATQPQPFTAVIVDPGAMDTAMQTTLRDAPSAALPSAAELAQRQRGGQLAEPGAVATWAAALLQSPRLCGGERYHVRDGLPS